MPTTISNHKTITYEFIDCVRCMFPFALPDNFLVRLRTSGETFYCPQCGCSMSWKKTIEENAEIARLKKSLKWEQDYATLQREAKEQAERSLAATKGVVTRMKNRAAAGLCPCCNRHFTNLERHMHTKHPTFKDSA